MNITNWVKQLPEQENFWRVVLITIGILGLISGEINPVADAY